MRTRQVPESRDDARGDLFAGLLAGNRTAIRVPPVDLGEIQALGIAVVALDEAVDRFGLAQAELIGDDAAGLEGTAQRAGVHAVPAPARQQTAGRAGLFPAGLVERD